MTTLAFFMLVITIFTGLLGWEGGGTSRSQLPRSAGLWTWMTTGNWSAKVGAGLIILGMGALLRYLLIHVDIPNALKLGSGLAASALLAAAALHLRAQPERRGLRLALAGAAGGVAYLTAYSAYALFHYVTQPSMALSLLVLVALVVGAIAVQERAQSMAVLAMLGGFMAPYFAIAKAPPLQLNAYYLLLSGWTLAVVAVRGWRALIHLSFLFTLAATLFFGWANNYYAPEHYTVMLPMFLALVGVHLAMPLMEAQHHQQRSGWLGRVDQGYHWALPAAALALAGKLAPSSDLAALAIALLAGVWFAGAALAHFLRQDSVPYLWRAAAMVLLALVVHFYDLNLPWVLVGVLALCAVYLAAPRLGIATERQDWLVFFMLVLSAVQILEGAVHAATVSMLRTYAESFALSGALLWATWVGQQRGNRFVDVMGWVGGLWAVLTVVNLLLDLQLTHWSSILFVAALVGSGVLWALRHRVAHAVAPAVMAIWLIFSSQGAVMEIAKPWSAGVLPLVLLAMAALAHTASSHRAGQADGTVAGIVLLLLPLALWPWANETGRYFGWSGASFGGSAVMAGVLVSAALARALLPRESRWHRDLAPVIVYIIVAVLAFRLVLRIERDAWAVVFELLALAYLALRAWWTGLDARQGAPASRYGLWGVLLGALFLQAQCLRVWGPPGRVLNVLALGQMQWPVLLSLLWAGLGAALMVGGHRLKERPMWSAGAGLLLLAAGKIVLLDTGSLGSLPNILAVLAAGGVFLAVSWLAPFPPPPAASPRASGAARGHARGSMHTRTQGAQAQALGDAGEAWSDTTPLQVASSSAPSSESLGAGHSARRRPAPVKSPSGNLWAWCLVGLVLLLIWKGSQKQHVEVDVPYEARCPDGSMARAPSRPLHGMTQKDMELLEPLSTRCSVSTSR